MLRGAERLKSAEVRPSDKERQTTGSSPYLPLRRGAAFVAKGGLLTFSESANVRGACSGSGHSAGVEIQHLFGSAVIRSEPEKCMRRA